MNSAPTFKKIKVIYIAGIYHSGSTILDRALGSHHKIVGLGEVFKTFMDGPEPRCSCGQEPKNCEFWSGILTTGYPNLTQFYERVTAQFQEHCGESTVLLDSSKVSPFKVFKSNEVKWQGLEFWKGHDQVELFTLHLVKDPRSWVSSLHRRDRKLRKVNRRVSDSWFRSAILRTDFGRYLQWLYSHVAILRYLNSNELNRHVVSYEEFCMRPVDTINEILKFVGVEECITEVDLGVSNSHIVVGNPSRHDKSVNKSITYDARWMRDDVSLTGSLMFYAMRVISKWMKIYD